MKPQSANKRTLDDLVDEVGGLSPKRRATKTTTVKLCMFCSGNDGKHSNARVVCQIKAAAMSALMASIGPAEAMLIADRTNFLAELVKRLPPEVTPMKIDGIKLRMFVYLDELRDSGITNMYGARPYLIEEFDIEDEKYAGQILSEWMQTYAQRHPQGGTK